MKPRGVVAAGHAATAAAAAETLRAGGNAVDAAVAGAFAACVVEPVLASLGGGGFLLSIPAGGRGGLVYDFFAQTPRRRRRADDSCVRSIDAEFGGGRRQRFHIGLGAIATPGAIRGLFAAHAERGFTPMRTLAEPAAALARDGHPVSAFQASILPIIGAILNSDPACRALFASPERPSEPIGEGERLRIPDLAAAIEALAIEGADLFYRGEMGRPLLDACAAGGGHLRAEDLEGYRVERRAPLERAFPGGTLAINPPPATGGALVALTMEILDAAALRNAGFGSAGHLCGVARALAAATAERRDAGLDGFADDDAAERLFAPGRLARVRAAANAPPSTRGTTHLSVIDGDGGLAALSLTNGEGSGYVLPGAAIHLNNMLGEDDINPGAPLEWPEDRRMSSMMAPCALATADARFVLGSGGSARIRSALAQTLVNLLVFDRPLAAAIETPRLHVEADKISVEPGFSEEATAALDSLGRNVDRWGAKSLYFGGVHGAAVFANGGFEGAGDPRRDGAAIAL